MYSSRNLPEPRCLGPSLSRCHAQRTLSLAGRRRARDRQQIECTADPRRPAAHTKKKTRYATERDTEEEREQRRVYQAKMRVLNAKDLLFVDETGVNLAMVRLYARAPKGERISVSAPVNKGKNITVLGVLSLEGLVEAMTIEGSSDGPVFTTFIQEVCVPVLRPGQTVIMDNLSAHKVEGIQQAIEAVGARREYLPPYSPDLSPIEECWSKVKTILRAKAARTSAHLDEAITEVFDLITPKDARGWFAHCGYL